jgi:hypothetical protein
MIYFCNFSFSCLVANHNNRMEDCYRKQVQVDEELAIVEILDTAGSVSIVIIPFSYFPLFKYFKGTIHCNERFIHQEWSGVCKITFVYFYIFMNAGRLAVKFQK